MKPFPIMCVKFWTHDPRINDCAGNSKFVLVKARTTEEATRKADRIAKKSGERFFRLRSVGPWKL